MSKLTHESLRQMISEEISKLESSKSEPKSVKVTAKQLRGIILQEVNSLNEQASGKADSVFNMISLIANDGRGPADKQEVLDLVSGLRDLGWHSRQQLALFDSITEKYADDQRQLVSNLLSALVGGKDPQSKAVRGLLSDDDKAAIDNLVMHTEIDWA
jgi:hypothetical protein